MTQKADFTPEEWGLLCRAPYSVAYAVITASLSGMVGTLKELAVIGLVLEETHDRDQLGHLTRAVVDDLRATQSTETESVTPEDAASTETRAATLATCRAVSHLLTARVSADEAESFRRWLLALGRRVAEASREGGLFGLGSQPVSTSEAELLAEIAGALGLAGA